MNAIKPLELADRPLIMQYLRQFSPEVSELTFTNLFVWRHSRAIAFTRIEDTLVFIASVSHDGDNDLVLLGPPSGFASPAAIIAALESEVRGWVRVSAEVAATLEGTDLVVVEDRDNFDYVYRAEDLAELSGRRYHKKRNLVKQCLDTYSCRYEEITPLLIGECLAMQDRWCEARACGVNPGLCKEYRAIQEAFEHYTKLELVGGAIHVDGIVQAFSIGEALRTGTAVCHFEKAMPEIQGLGQLINQWFARYSLRGFEFLNREQDLGIPGLRQAKESYFPHHLVRKYSAFFHHREMATCSGLDPQECARHLFGGDQQS